MWHKFGPRGWFLGKFLVEVLSVRQESTKMGRELKKYVLFSEKEALLSKACLRLSKLA